VFDAVSDGRVLLFISSSAQRRGPNENPPKTLRSSRHSRETGDWTSPL